MNSRVFLIVALLVLATNVFAQPEIYGVTGDLEPGGTITISGVDFGDRWGQSPILYDTIDNQAAYEPHNLDRGDEIPVVSDGDCPDCPWQTRIPPTWGGVAPKYYDVPDSVRVAGRPMYKVSKKGYFRGPESFADLNDDDHVYMTWWVWSNHSLRNPPGNWEACKIIRFTAGSGSDSWQDQVEIVAHCLYGTGLDCSASGWTNWGNQTFPAQQWNRVELHLAGGGDMENGSGEAELYVNGQLKVRADNVFSCYGLLDHILVWGADPSNPSATYPSDSVILFGEMYVDATQARVLVTTDDDYQLDNSSPTTWEIQPTMSWDGTTITANLNLGNYEESDQLYLYVVDENGQVSTPFELDNINIPSEGPGQPGRPYIVSN